MDKTKTTWDMAVNWEKNATPEEYIAANEFIKEITEEMNTGMKPFIPACIQSFTFNKITE